MLKREKYIIYTDRKTLRHPQLRKIYIYRHIHTHTHTYIPDTCPKPQSITTSHINEYKELPNNTHSKTFSICRVE